MATSHRRRQESKREEQKCKNENRVDRKAKIVEFCDFDLNDAVEDSSNSEISMQKDMVTDIDWNDFANA